MAEMKYLIVILVIASAFMATGIFWAAYQDGHRDGYHSAMSEMEISRNCEQHFHGHSILQYRAKEIAYATCKEVAVCIAVANELVDCEQVTCERCGR